MSHRAMQTTLRQDLLAALPWALLAGAVATAAILALYLLPGWAALPAAVAVLGVPLILTLARGPLAPRRLVLARVLALLAIALMALSAYAFRPTEQSIVHFRPTPQPEVYAGLEAPVLLALGAGALLAALRLARDRQDATRPRAVGVGARAGGRVADLLALAGAGSLAALAEINSGLLSVDALTGAGPHMQFALLAGGVALLALGLGGVARPHSLRGALRIELVLVLLLTGIALGARFWALATSVRTLVDEGHFALGIGAVWDRPDLRLLEPMPTVASFPYLFSYLQAQAVAVLGRNWAGLRAISAILGGLTIPALYLLARTLYDRLTALLAALVLVSLMPHLHFSRLGLNNIADPLFGTLALALLARGVKSGRRLDYALGGAALGMTQYFYEGGRMLFPALAGVWLGAGWLLWRPRPAWRGLLIALVVFGAVAAPVYLTLAGDDLPLFNRLDSAGFNEEYWTREREPDTLGTRWTHFQHAAGLLVHSPENTYIYYYLYYGGDHPLVHEYLVPAFFLGLALAAWQWRGPGGLPLLWVLGTVAGNAMLVESAVSARFVVVFPALALAIALGLRGTARLLAPGGRLRRMLEVALVGAGVAIALWQGATYFGPFLDGFNHEVRAHVDYDVDDALLRAQVMPPNAHLIIVGGDILPELDTRRHLKFLRDDLTVQVMDSAAFATFDPAQLPAGVDLALFVPPGDPVATDRARQAFNAIGPLLSPYDLPPEKMLWMYVARMPGG